MTRQRTTAILSILFLLALADCASAADGPTTRQTSPPSNTVYGTRVLQIQWDRASGFVPDVGALADALVRSDQVAALAKEILALSPLPPRDLNVYSSAQETGASINLELALPPEARHGAKEFLDALVNLARAQLKQQHLQWQDRQLELHAVALKRESQVVNELRSRIEDRRDQARQVTGRLDVSPEAIRTAAAKLEDLRTTLELDAVGGAARRKAIEEGIAKISDREEKRVKEDPAVVELNNVVKVREQSMERVQKMYETGQVSAADLSQAQAATAEAKARVAIRRSDVATATGGELLAQLNRELTMLSIDTLEKRIRLDFIEKQLARLKDAPSLLDGIEGDQAALSRALVRLEAATVQSQELERRLGSMRPPTVIVQGSRDEDPDQHKGGIFQSK